MRLVGLRVAPLGRDAQLTVVESRDIRVERLRVGAGRTRFHANVRLLRSRGIVFAGSRFARCGERTACLFPGHSSDVRVSRSRFVDCYGCDFIRGIFTRRMVLSGNTFDRALVGRCGRNPAVCNHQDLVQIQGGRGLVVERNRFGVYELPGGGQLYLLGQTDDVVVRNNVFLPTDAKVPGVLAHVGINLGGSSNQPRRVVIANNTVLTGSPRPDKGVATSVRLVPGYARIPLAERPVLANNVVALANSPNLLCDHVQASTSNVVVSGAGCSDGDVVGDPALDARGRPTAASALTIDRADRGWATAADFRGVRRDENPDIGAYEYVPRR